MKISKKAVLLVMSGIFTMMSLGLMLVFAENFSIIDLNVDPNNAIQHFKEVKIISTGANEDAYAIINKKGKLVGIDTVYNFVLTEQQQDLGGETKLVNQISRVSRGSTILGGTGNKIEKNNYNGILGGKENIIEAGHRNSILGGIVNAISGGNSSVIFGGRENVVTGSYSSIVGGEKNKVTKGYAIAVGNNNIANGYNSVAMGSGSKVQSENSFLWTDGKAQERLAVKGTFAVEGEKGMVINTTKAHSLAQLTVSGSLIVYDNKKALECTDDTKGVLKVINGDVYNNNQKCFCSCDGSGRNALHEGTRCESLCSNGTGLQAECGMVRVDCETTPYSYTGAGTSGACIIGELVEGTGAFLVDTHSDDTEWIHRSCQTSYGQVTGCQQQLTGESCPNLRTGHECIWDHEELTGHLITNPDLPRNSASFWKYDPELEGPCTYKCDQYGEWDSDQKKCIFHECRGDLPEGAKLNDEMALPLNDTTDYFYSDTSTGACSYKCNIEFGYYYSGTLNKCVTCPEGQTYDESDGTCKVACDMSNTSFETITIMDESGYAITIADRNLGATSNNTGEVSSYGCYFQRGNNYGFQPQGNLETSTDFVDTRGYGPGNPYVSEIFRVRTGEITNENGGPIFGPNDDDWSSPANNNLWGGAYDSGNNAFGVLDPDKENRRGPCPEGYHVPSIGERNDLLTIWYNKEYKSGGSGNLPYIKDSGKIISFRGTGDGGLGWAESMRFVRAFRDYFKLPPASSREFIDFAPGITYGQGGSFWTSSSPRLTGSFTSNSLAKDRVIKIHPNVANSFDYNLIGEGYVGHGLTGRKRAAQSVRCFKDVPECPSGKVWNQSELRCENRTDCDVEHTAIQDLELFLISSTGEISHFTMMDRNLGAFEVYNQKGENEQNARSLGCHFQWGNNNGFSLGAQSTRYGINPTSYSPSTYSNNKIYCKNRDGSTGDVSELDEDDLNEGGNILGSQYTPINYHLWGGGYILYNRVFRTGYGSDGSDVDRRGPCPEGYHVPRGIEMDDFVNNWNDASSSRGAIGKNFASDLLMPYGRYIEVYCGEQNRLKVGGGIWLSDHIYKYYTGDVTGGHYFDHIGKFTDNSAITFSRNGLAHGFPVRCIKNNMTTSPQKITIHSDGGTGAVIAIDWETEGTGKITALGTPTKNGIDFLGWYSSPSFAAEFKVNTGDYISSGGHLYARWDGCNIVDTAVQDLEVFFLLSPSRISHYVMMDRNLGAAEAFNQDISSPNESSYGCYFQWGNIYPFNRGRNGSSYITGTLTNTKDYGPNTVNGYYSNSMRHCREPRGESGHVMYPVDNSNYPYATWLWGGGATSDGINYTRAGWGSGGSDIDRQGPCPAGYHIPRGIEMKNIMQEWKNVSDCPYETGTIALQKTKQFASELLLPFAGFNGIGCPQNEYLGGGTIGNYMISDYIYGNYRNHLHMGISSAGDGLYLYLNGPSYGYSLRCVKNNISDTPQKVTINAYGGTGAVIAIDWETPENGRIVTLGEPKRAGYDFGGWYSNESLTTDIKVGDSISDGGDLYAKWIRDQEFEDLELYFLKDDGNIIHYTMMDRNMGATEIYNQNFDNPNVESFGYHYQWGNNWGFKPCIALWSQCGTFPGGESYTTDERVQKSEWSLNTKSRYVSNVYREIVSSPFNWMADANAVANDESTDMWGGKGDTKTSNGAGTVSDRQGPCPDEYYVPSTLNWGNIIGSWKKSTPDTKDGIKMASDLLLPVAGARDYQSKYVQNQGSFGRYWSSSLRTDENSRAFSLRFASGDILPQQPLNISRGASVRCVKGVTNPQTINIHANGGIKAVIAIDGGKITALGEPSKSGYKFEGWYLDTGFNNPINTGDYISNDGHLYAKWDELIAVFMEGSGFNNILSSLAGVKGNISNVKRADSIASGVITGLISDIDSPVPIIAWYDSGSIYYYSEANKIYLNENSQGMFESFSNLEQIDMSGWNTSNVINMAAMFSGCESLSTLDLNGFDTAKVTDMSYMFSNCSGLVNLAVSGWNTSNVTNMESIFRFCRNLTDLDVSKWNTSSVTTMKFMFQNCEKLEHLDVSEWKTSNVINMAGIFNQCQSLTTLDVSNWDTSNVIYMSDMFNHCTHLKSLDLSNFNTSKVTTMYDMFTDCYELTGLDLSSFDTSNVTRMDMMFQSCSNLKNVNLTSFNTSKVISMRNMFAGSASLTELDLSNFDTSNVTDMKGMFASCHDLRKLDISSFDTSKVTNMREMFRSNFALTGLDLRNFNTSKVTNMGRMFSGSLNLKVINVSSFDTSKVEVMSGMFGGCYELETIYASTGFVTTSVIDSDGMFEGDEKLVGGNGTRYTSSHVDDYYAKIDEPGQTGYLTEFRYTTLLPGNDFRSEMLRLAGSASNIKQILYTGNMPMGTVTGIVSVDGFEPVIAGYKNGIIYLTTDAIKIYLNEDASVMFSGLSMVTKIDTTKWDTIKTTDMSNMFKGCSSLEELDVSNRNTSNVANMSNMFEGCESLINLDVSKWNTKKVTDMSYLFSNCINLTGLNVREWNTSNVTSMRLMFGGRGQLYMKLENLDVSNWNTSKVIDMAGMFQNCDNLINLDVSMWNTSKVTDINHMFYDCYNLTNLDVSNWDTSNVTNMRTLFYECESLTGLDVSRWDTSKVTDMGFMFGGTEDHAMKLEKLDVSNWDTSNVTGMHSMFQHCQSLTGLDVSRWNVGKVVDMNSIFNDCRNLTSLDVSNWNTKNVTNMYGAFDDCYNLTNLDVSNWDTSNVTDMGFMFGGTEDHVMKLTELDLSNWDTSNVTNMECMFQSCSNLKTIYASTGFVVDQVTNSDKMFYRDTKLVGGFGTKFIDTYRDKTYAKVDSEVQSGYFTQLKATYLLPGTQFNQTIKRLAGQNSATYETSNTTITQIKQWTGNDIPSGVTTGLLSQNDSVYPTYAWFKNGTIYYYTKADKIYLNEDASYMFNMLTGLINVEINEWNTSKVTNMKSMFYGCSNLTKLDVSNWNTFKVTNMSSMFENCYNLINLDVSNWNTSNMSDMSRMFVDCSSLEELDVSKWNTSNVTTMFAVFGGNKNYMNLKHLDVSNWDTSKVTTMRSMFRNCIELTGLDVSKWNTSNVENMYMLFGAEYDYMNLEYIDVSKWDTSKVTNMRGTFRNCIKLTGLNVSNWNTSNVTNMNNMFASMAEEHEALPMNIKILDVSKWDTSKVTNMNSMFQNCRDLSGLDVSNWDTSNVTDMNHMFYGCNKLTKLDVSNWDTSNVTNMNSIFYRCNLTELDLTNRKTNKVTDMRTMFYNNTNLKTIYASTGFVTTNISSSASGASLFHNDTKLVGGFGTKYSSSHININYAKIDSESQSGYFTQLKATYLLPGTQFNQTIKKLAGQNSATYTTSNTNITQIKQWTGSNIPSGVTTGLLSQNDSVYPTYAWFKNGTIYYYTKADRIYLNEDSSYMFNMLKNLENIDMSEWKTNRVTNMEGIFGGCSSLTELNLINWNTSNVTNMKGMFSGCSSLTELDIGNFYTRNVTDMSSMFDSCNALTQLNLEGIHTENVTNMQRMFYGCHSLTELDVSSFDISNVTNLSMMFENDSNLTSLDVSNWDTSKVSDMSRVFVDCSSLEELDVSNWDTSNVTTMYGLFAGDDNGMNLKYLDVSNFDTSKVTNMGGVFRNCVNLTSVDVSKWKTSNVIDMSQMFYGNAGFVMNLEYVDVSKWDTSNVTDMSDMFQKCENLVGLDVSNWKTSKVTDMNAMFNYCKKLTNLDVSKWDTSKVTNMEIMFGECSNLIELDLSNWNTSKVTNMDGMFLNNARLKTIYASPLFVTTGVTDSTKMFIYDTKLVGGNGTKYSSSHTNKEYARIDQPGTPGYFTLKQ